MKIAVLNSVGIQTDDIAKLRSYYLVDDSYNFSGNLATEVTSIENLWLFRNMGRINFADTRQWIKSYYDTTLSTNWSARNLNEKKILAKLFIVDLASRQQVLSDGEIYDSAVTLIYEISLKAIQLKAGSIKASTSAYIEDNVINDPVNVYDSIISTAIGSLYVAENAASTPVISTGIYIKPSGTVVPGSINQKFVLYNSSLKYIGANPFTGVASCDGDVVADIGSKNISVGLLKNGVLIEKASRDLDVSINNTASFSLAKNVSMVSGDYVSVGLRNKASTQSFVITNYNLIIK